MVLPVFAAFALTVLMSGCAVVRPRPPVLKEAPRLRVGLAVDAKTLTLTGTGVFQITIKDSGRKPKVCAPGEAWTLVASRDMDDTLGVEVIDPDGLSRGVLQGTLLVTSDEPGSYLVYGGRGYRGSMEVFVGSSGLLTLVNVVDLESYLRGVVPNEIGGLSPDILEAIKAQAVAARTYCFYFRGRYKDQGFDVLPTVQDQVYTGVAGERPMSDRAILETYGVIAVYNGQPIRANYCSTCGGATASIEEVWPYEPVPYLTTVEDKRSFEQPFCNFSPTYRWTEIWTAAQLDSIFKKYYRQVFPNAAQPAEDERIVDVRVAERSKSGRVRILEVYTTDNVYRVVGDAIRLVLRRPDGKDSILRSTLFDVDAQRDQGFLTSLTLSGGGNGHGVGMCQNGAIGMARQRATFDKILAHYYRGSKLVRAY